MKEGSNTIQRTIPVGISSAKKKIRQFEENCDKKSITIPHHFFLKPPQQNDVVL